jgi:hypothetical protein
MPLVMGACEVVGVGLSVADGVGLAEVGDGDGLAEVGDGVGDGLFCAWGLAGAHGVDDGTALFCPAEAPDEGAPELP